MNPRIAKDIRLIALTWAITIALMIAASALPQIGKGWAVAIAIFGCLTLAASIFGGEFSHGTISQLLAQPIDRRRIWREKMTLVALGLASVILTVVAIEGTPWFGFVGIVAACAFCTLPFFTLVGRNTLSGIILSVPIPGIIFLIGALLALWLLRPSAGTVNEDRLQFWMNSYFYIVLPAYCAVVFYLGYRRFVNFEVAGREQPGVRLPGSVQARVERVASNLIPAKYRHVRALVAKELHLQHNTMILFLIFTALQLLGLICAKLAHVEDADLFFIVPLFMYVGIIPLVIGSSAIAEENNLGTRAWHLTLPCSVAFQWFTKLSVVLIAATVFGVAAPLFWVVIGRSIGLLGSDSFSPPLALFFCLVFCPPALLVTFIAFYASSFSRDTLRALLTAFAICTGIVFMVALGGGLFESSSLPQRISQYSAAGGAIRVLTTGWVLVGLPLSCFLFLLLRSSFKHFASLDRRRIWPNLLTVVLSPILLFFLLLTLAFLIR